MQNRTLNNQTEVKSATPANAVIRGRYGIISLFDGVSSVVPILRKKLGYPPVAVILAECDLSLRQLVCTEFTYRSDFFFCCIAELAIKPCRSSRSKLRGEFGIPNTCKTGNKNTTKQQTPPNPKHNTTQNKKPASVWNVKREVRRG